MHLPSLKLILRRSWTAPVVALLLGSTAFGQQDNPAVNPPEGGEAAPVMQEISPGVFQIGKIRLDKTKRSVSFPAKLNMAQNLVEYVLVTPHGSTHESLLTAEIQPTDLQFVMLLLNAKGAGLLAPSPKDAPPGQINAEYLHKAPRLKGDNISMTVSWKQPDGTVKSVPVEDLLVNTDTKKPATRGPWIYNGSMFGSEGAFLAQQEGSFVAVVTNPAALINNPRKGNDNDQIWTVNEKAVPAVGTPVEFTITLLPGDSETK
jgi:hypothetical protein